MTIERENVLHSNRLINESSPYLLQHAQNPVDWYPWGEEAFDRARREDKPVFLSIGYSACHWCHVMAHESFENSSIAAYMNENFINIKVDREEYPDLDHIYQSFVQMSMGQGGWPLSVFLTPGKVPFYGGTYFPAQPRYGMISFPELLRKISDIYKNEPEKIAWSAEEVKAALSGPEEPRGTGSLPQAGKVFDNVFRTLSDAFDPRHGGFSSAPKFPHASDINFLLNYYHYAGIRQAKEMALFTLKKMAMGGIYDQLGGGFHRYATDAFWLVPHFEKMLYDNALLISLYADAYRLSSDIFYRRIALETADFVLREMTSPGGGFYSSLDADSEGGEGQFYVWDFKEILDLLDDEFAHLFMEFYGVSREGDFEGKNILHTEMAIGEFADKNGKGPAALERKLNEARHKLLVARGIRARPATDTKILTDWNGMMISALWEAYKIGGNESCRRAAEKAAEFIRRNYLDKNFSLSHTGRNRNECIPGYLDDYAWFIRALLDGFEVTQKEDYLDLSVKLTEHVLNNFTIGESGGFYFTDSAIPVTVMRPRQHYDASTPAGNSIMALNLLRLHAYSGAKDYLNRAEEIFKEHKGEMESNGTGLISLVRAYACYHYSPVEITVSAAQKQSAEKILKAIWKFFIPNQLLVVVRPGEKPARISPDLYEGRERKDGPAIFICHRRSCSPPLTGAAEIPKILEGFGLKIG